ncbi:PucR family transcriptional regulator [Salipaludibacillus aurantiacus]|uniref:Sugar diacid utilization regulator n=1 Tax=Salipaludibacillus aurantiacus TaxID=1601833 RepID=A0A1H9W0X5_9BACI|nr:helix-turn-helix domain-containing protein [Salipaludibacillus aurantiacus]SES27317.1 Sugar diacid utilization regulator [Salipaludibacillus aurantiacus]
MDRNQKLDLHSTIPVKMMNDLAAGKSYSGMLQTICTSYKVQAVLTDDIFQTLAFADENKSYKGLEYIDVLDGNPSIVFDRLRNEEWTARRFELVSDNLERAGFLYVNDEIFERPSFNRDDFQKMLVFFSTAIQAENRKRKEVLQQGLRFKEAFLYDLLYGNLKEEGNIRAQAETWNWGLNAPHTVIAFELQKFDTLTGDEVLLERCMRKWETTLIKQLINPMMLKKRNEIILFYPVKHISKIKENEKKIRDSISLLIKSIEKISGDREFHVGIGRPYAYGKDYFRSYQEARVAREIGISKIGETVIFFQDIGLLKLLYSHDPQELYEYYHDTLDELIMHDEKTEADLIEALRAYIKNDLDLKKTSEAMHMHRNSVRYRLTKIEELLDIDLNDLSVIIKFSMAFQIESLAKMRDRLRTGRR